MSLEHIICPSSVAVFGASNKEGSVGKAVTSNIISGEFTGKIFPINPSSNTVLGLKCYKTIFDIESHVDLAVIVTPSEHYTSNNGGLWKKRSKWSNHYFCGI